MSPASRPGPRLFAHHQHRRLAGNVSRWLGIRVRKADGTLPGLPDYLAVGSVSQDTTTDLAMWRNFGGGASNTRVDARYIYLNDGPYNPTWTSWGGNPNNWYGETSPLGARCYGYVRESLKLGMIPYFVWYNIDGTGDSFTTDTGNAQNADFMAGYFTDLVRMCNLVKGEAPDETVGIVIEPDFIGYLAQNGVDPTTFPAAHGRRVHRGRARARRGPGVSQYDHGLRAGGELPVLQESAARVLRLGVRVVGAPGGRLDDALRHARPDASHRRPVAGEREDGHRQGPPGDLQRGRRHDELLSEVRGGQLRCGVRVRGQIRPRRGRGKRRGGRSARFDLVLEPDLVEQLPDVRAGDARHFQAAGHALATPGRPHQRVLPSPTRRAAPFPNLANTYQHYEDSAPDFFFGDTFTPGAGNRFNYFSGATNGADTDPQANLLTNGGAITWGSAMGRAANAGVRVALFGAGVGDSTAGTGNPPTDGGWWITATQGYYLNGPVPLAPGT